MLPLEQFVGLCVGLLVAFAGFFQTELFFNEFRYVCFMIQGELRRRF